MKTRPMKNRGQKKNGDPFTMFRFKAKNFRLLESILAYLGAL